MPTTREEQVDVRAVIADELSRVTRLLMIFLGAVSLLGTHAGLADGGGEAYLPYAVIAAPSIVSVWANLELPPAVTAIAVVLGVALLAATAVFATRRDR